MSTSSCGTTPSTTKRTSGWQEGALLGRREDELAVVEFEIDANDARRETIVRLVVDELENILGGPDPWRYARRWATSAVGNFYGRMHWGYFMGLVDAYLDFGVSLKEFEGFERLSFTVGELRADSTWPWGEAHGAYCFLVDGKVVYVGRAAGNTIGARLWDQLRSTSDPGWAHVVSTDENTVELFLLDEDWVDRQSAHMACALECYLIARLHPEFNLRSV